MIARLRRRHRLIWLVLLVLVPVMLVIALSLRPPAPELETLPAALEQLATETSEAP